MGTNLITGGFGFIGQHLMNLLREQGEEVAIFDVVGASRFGAAPEGVKVFRGDVCNWAQVLDAVKESGAECIFHAGAILPPVSEQSPQAAFSINVTGTFNVLEAARLFGVKQVILLSTLATFGRDVPRIVPNDVAQHPPSMYGTTKVCAERLGEYYHRRFGIDFRGVRLTPLMGMGRFDTAQSAYIYRAVQDAVLGKPYAIYVAPETPISVTYVKDAAWGLLDLKNAPQDKLTRRVYNLFGFLATGGELAEVVKQVIPEAQLEFKPDPKMIELVMNLPERLDDTLARHDWGWNLRYDLERSVRDMVADIRKHRHVYEQ
ncbi:MAG: NAD-dependent epimerase/dehydratase family protein [Dehalococcoidia bacterium]|jgi:threonine 3-dehydrogenase|nr:NAD-dependent epimerase/dehydratase family protein [Dehalococcoidia bacterium]